MKLWQILPVIFDEDLYYTFITIVDRTFIHSSVCLPVYLTICFLDLIITVFKSNSPFQLHSLLHKLKLLISTVDLDLPLLVQKDNANQCCAAAAAAAKSLQSCPTLCDPRDGSPPGSPVPGILQARTLEWVAISFSKA